MCILEYRNSTETKLFKKSCMRLFYCLKNIIHIIVKHFPLKLTFQMIFL